MTTTKRQMVDDDDTEGYAKVDHYHPVTVKRVADKYRTILKDLGENPDREGLLKTPERVAKALHYLTHGYDLDPAEFFGKAHVAYIPNGRIVGLSKIPRIVDAFARRLQVQERLTMEVRNCIEETLKPLGVAVVIEAKHLCMVMRGIQKQNSTTTTSAFTGEFNTDKTRSEFLRLIQ